MLPNNSVPLNPDPNSNPLVAGIDIIACANFEDNLSKQGSPKPVGTFLITQVTVPPILFLASLVLRIRSIIFELVSLWGHRVMSASTSSRVTVFKRSINSFAITFWYSTSVPTGTFA
eukprot:NODE_812_length_3739_cov_0.536813.p4 type:complete len:117 gc:universal NODE_812_length_3739_cov_0.536813:2059-1709(-)